MADNPPIVRETAANRSSSQEDAVVSALESDIIFGRLRARERLIEDDLMKRFQVTRHRVRMAIGELVNRGLVVQERNRGAHVRDYTRTAVEDLYEIRNALQSHAIQRMPLPLTEERLQALRRLYREHVAAGERDDLENVFRLNNAFHDQFYQACGNTLLADAIRDYAWRTHPIRSRGFLQEDYRRAAQAEHAQIVDAAEAGDRDLLILLNRRHTTRPCQIYVRYEFGGTAQTANTFEKTGLPDAG